MLEILERSTWLTGGETPPLIGWTIMSERQVVRWQVWFHFSGHIFHWFLSGSIGTFSASGSIKKTPFQHFHVGVVWGRKRHYLIKSSNSDRSDRFIPPERQQSKVSPVRSFHFSFQRATLYRQRTLLSCRREKQAPADVFVLSSAVSLVVQATVGTKSKPVHQLLLNWEWLLCYNWFFFFLTEFELKWPNRIQN